MFDLGFSELLVIGIVALIVIGPKDLPVMFRRVGQMVGKARGMARDFSRAMNDAADDAGVKDVASTFKSAADGINTVSNPMKSGVDVFKNTAKSAAKSALNGDDETTDSKPDSKPDSETDKLKAKQQTERMEAARKIEVRTARVAAERRAKEAEAELARAREVEADMEKELSKPADPET